MGNKLTIVKEFVESGVTASRVSPTPHAEALEDLFRQVEKYSQDVFLMIYGTDKFMLMNRHHILGFRYSSKAKWNRVAE